MASGQVPNAVMTERIYYDDPSILEFDATIVGMRDVGGRTAVLLDRSAFYPTSGGQLFDTGELAADGQKVSVSEVMEDESGEVLHIVSAPLRGGAHVAGSVDAARRRDHMQQHTGQHLLSAVFIELFGAATVSFHMGDDSCTIDLDTRALSEEQIRQAERRANEIVTEDRQVEIRWASAEEARALGVRKIPPGIERLRLIDIREYDLTACGGTHVRKTGEIGAILLRKVERVKQGVRVEFVCGERAVATARRDFATLTDTAALLSAHIYDLPAQVRKALDEAKTAGKRQFKLQEELAEFMADKMLAVAEQRGAMRLVRSVFADRDLVFIKLLAQKLTVRTGVVALLGSTVEPPSVVFAQSAGGPYDMGALLKQAVAAANGRGGGTRDMAQGGARDVGAVVETVAAKL